MQTFKKDERLHGKKSIQRLFSKGRSYNLSSFKIYWQEVKTENEYPVQVLIAVSKRTIRKAVRRNLLKRRIREAYRKNKSNFYKILTNRKKHYHLAIVYIGREIIPYQDIEKKIIQILERLITEDQNLK